MRPKPGNEALRRAAREVQEAALAAACPEAALRESLEVIPGGFLVGGARVTLPGRLIVVGAGKAAARMALEVERLFGERIGQGLVITPYGHALPSRRVDILEAAHPLPDAAGVAAAARLEDTLCGLSSDDLVLCLISGGASALMPAPARGVTLEAKQAVTDRLLRAGASIGELNAVRKHLSRLKGGQLALQAEPARVVSLVMSDVVGDPLDAIASGPTAPDPTTYRDAETVLVKYGIEGPPEVAERIRRGVSGEIPETPKPGDPLFRRVSHHIVANNRRMVEAAAACARRLGFETGILGTNIEGEAREIGRRFASMAREASPRVCVVGGGETTVRVRGAGRGGRNLEMALAWAVGMRGWKGEACFASIASDGADGPTDAAGGRVDPDTCERIEEAGLDPSQCLEDNDSLRALEASGDRITTGPTGTNLMDLQVLLVGETPGP